MLSAGKEADHEADSLLFLCPQTRGLSPLQSTHDKLRKAEASKANAVHAPRLIHPVPWHSFCYRRHEDLLVYVGLN